MDVVGVSVFHFNLDGLGLVVARRQQRIRWVKRLTILYLRRKASRDAYKERGEWT
jgi:hypothetical protein